MILGIMPCLVCLAKSYHAEFGLGNRPLSSEFINNSSGAIKLFDMTLILCKKCNTIQLKNPPKYLDLIPTSPLTKSIEPEDHLDLLVSDLESKFGEYMFSSICGLSYKDNSLLERFKTHFRSFTKTLDPKLDLGITESNSSIETIQATLSTTNQSLHKSFGLHTLVVARHILEHSSNLLEFLQSCTALLMGGGYLLIEIPDATQNLIGCDYTMVWEEHAIYLDLHQLCFILNFFGLEVVYYRVFPLPFESSIVVIAKQVGAISRNQSFLSPTYSLVDPFMRFSSNFQSISSAVVRALSREYSKGRKISIFGAGHLACAFIHYFKIQNLIQYCFDDSPNKIGKCLPGTSIPIINSSEIPVYNIDLLLTAVSIKSEGKILKRFSENSSSPSNIYSIFVNSPISIYNKEFMA